MFEKSANSRHKNEARVTIRVAGEEAFDAFVFLKIGERLIDLLNDDRKFIPVKRTDGSTVITSKNSIISIIENLEGDAQTFAAPSQARAEPLHERAAATQSPEPAAAAEPPAAEAPEAPKRDGEKAGAGADEPAADPAAEPQAEDAQEEAHADERRKDKRRRAFDPYDVLRVARGATADEIRRAYKKRIKAVHPDSIAALDLDEDIARAANLSAQRVNRAYQMLMRERQGEAKPAEDAA
jgi:hypothetical protein